MDYAIEKFKIRGHISIWEYNDPNPNRKCWNFTANDEGCDSLCELLNLMDSSKYSSTKLITITPPTAGTIKHVNDRITKWSSKPHLKIVFKNQEERKWEIRSDSNQYEILFDKTYIQQLINSVEKIKANQFDFAIADDSDNNVLYFWRYD